MYTKMVKKYKTMWLKALRSGKYKQGYHALKTLSPEPLYCCLGVMKACDKDVKIIKGGLLSLKYRRKIGLDYRAHKDLIKMNDASRKSFKQIANWIEKNL